VLGYKYGAAAGAFGAMLGDIIGGFAMWAPWTLVIKGVMAFIMGAIINFASMNTYRPLTRVAPYAMSKAAIANWTMFFAQYMAPANIRVNAIAPGFMVNERSRAYLMTPEGGLSPRGEQVIHHTPMGKFGEAVDLLGCVDWLLDDTASAFVTGITVPIDGGFLASAGV
jgi:NAD(P)-dependent dehydrogenase (short-subunit alcohol dehydrogenase family)